MQCDGSKPRVERELSLIACLSGGEKESAEGGCEGRQGGQTNGRGEKQNEDERNLPVLLLEDYRQCRLGQSHAS